MNNIYFDKLPERIVKSSNKDDVNTTEVRMWFKSDVKISPLTDRLAEERKKVVHEIWKEFEQRLMGKTKDMPIMKVCNMINSVLDQMERETDEIN